MNLLTINKFVINNRLRIFNDSTLILISETNKLDAAVTVIAVTS